ncbi:MAG: hypothetical protein GY810_29660 [Aureispira sp.]|nr:hypothetical protein [Aureispira sp.]
MKQKLILTFLFGVFAYYLFAHPGGHGYQDKRAKTWHFKDGTIATKGFLSITKDGKVYIENNHHELLTFPIDKMSIADQEFIANKESKVKQLNIAKDENKGLNYSALALSLLYASLFILVGLIGYRQLKRAQKRSNQ